MAQMSDGFSQILHQALVIELWRYVASDISGVSKHLPPQRFVAASGVEEVWRVAQQPKFRKGQDQTSRAKELGLKYEKKVQEKLREECPDGLELNPWFAFKDEMGMRYCSPDAILIAKDVIVVFEIKYSHTALAWWQLRRLYAPVLAVWGQKRVIGVEICHTMSQVEWPGPTFSFTNSWSELKLILTAIGLRPGVDEPEDHITVLKW